MDEGDFGVGLDEFEFSGHLDADRAAADNNDSVSGLLGCGDVGLSFLQVFGPCQRLRYDRPRSSET